MKDFMGQDLKVGDRVIFTMGGTNLRESVIEKILDKAEKGRLYGDVIYLKRIKRPFHPSTIFKISNNL